MSRTYSHSPYFYLRHAGSHSSNNRQFFQNELNRQDRREAKKTIRKIIYDCEFEERATFKTNKKTVSYYLW